MPGTPIEAQECLGGHWRVERTSLHPDRCILLLMSAFREMSLSHAVSVRLD